MPHDNQDVKDPSNLHQIEEAIEAAKHDVVVGHAHDKATIFNVGQAIRIATSIPKMAFGTMDPSVTMFDVEISAPFIDQDQSVNVQTDNANFVVAGSNGTSATGPFRNIKFDFDSNDEPQTFTVIYIGIPPVPVLPNPTKVTLNYYYSTSDTILGTFVQSETVMYAPSSPGILTDIPRPRKLTVGNIAKNVITLRWRTVKAVNGELTLSYNGSSTSAVLKSPDNNAAPTKVSITDKKTTGTFKLLNVATGPMDVKVSIASIDTVPIQASTVLHLDAT